MIIDMLSNLVSVVDESGGGSEQLTEAMNILTEAMNILTGEDTLEGTEA